MMEKRTSPEGCIEWTISTLRYRMHNMEQVPRELTTNEIAHIETVKAALLHLERAIRILKDELPP